ncbi:winged helix-turn-helix domain-containing protein [Paucilactobacillus hokkaidonensis]|uniref:winged helix-turn-helix domain-containing protein n=1 Tax=Paucilactobacillus hokkaidonensis TaxID=1193095 RepID=UPI0006D00E2E|nr:winged helix-turn-helix domain-containing protein [Paucilactobacillus hokkaidonensis]
MAISNMQSIKQSNYSAIYKLLYSNNKLSKQLIAEQLQLSLPTVSSNLQELINNQLVKKNGKFESQMGRRATAYSINPTAIVSLGVEIFYDHASVVLINTLGDLIATSRLSLMFERQESYFKQFGTWISNFIDNQKLKKISNCGGWHRNSRSCFKRRSNNPLW